MQLILFSLISGLFFTFTFFFRSEAIRVIPLQIALLIEALLQVLVFLVLMFFSFRKDQIFSFLSVGHSLYAVLAGCAVTLAIGAYVLAIKDGHISRVITVICTSQILFGMFLGTYLNRDIVSARQLMGAGLAIVSILLISLK
ncbi:EamA family transporter [Candidatus Gottesmanbacteria bacterium]|nr:EamA family transporter [Candidatus Gottesmanbacteria bacterium]